MPHLLSLYITVSHRIACSSIIIVITSQVDPSQSGGGAFYIFCQDYLSSRYLVRSHFFLPYLLLASLNLFWHTCSNLILPYINFFPLILPSCRNLHNWIAVGWMNPRRIGWEAREAAVIWFINNICKLYIICILYWRYDRIISYHISTHSTNSTTSELSTETPTRWDRQL